MSIPTNAALNAYANAAQMLNGTEATAAPRETGGGQSFGDVLNGVVDGVTGAAREGERQTAMAVAKEANLVDVVTAVAEAETTVQTIVTIRDRVIGAYQDIMRMPI